MKMPSKIANPQEFLDYACRPIDEALRKACEDHVRHDFCESFVCDKFEECGVAQHEVEMVRHYAWSRFVDRN